MQIKLMKIKFQLFLVICSIALSMAWVPSPKEGVYILYVFEGSDWCHNCIRLDKQIISTAAFTDFVEEQEITIEHIDFPQRKRLDEKTVAYNAEIAEKYNFQGIFPTLVLVHVESGRQTMLSYENEDMETFMSKIELEKTELR